MAIDIFYYPSLALYCGLHKKCKRTKSANSMIYLCAHFGCVFLMNCTLQSTVRCLQKKEKVARGAKCTDIVTTGRHERAKSQKPSQKNYSCLES